MTLLGTTVGKIRIVEQLGRGGMSEVYVGYDEKLERKVAVKVIRGGHRMDPRARDRFMREARLLSRLEHPNICRIYDYVEGDGRDFIILELIKGVELTRAVEGMPWKAKMHIASQIAEVLAVAHSRDIVHRDLKPSNVMITPEGNAKVLDFGLARAAGDQELHQGVATGLSDADTITVLKGDQELTVPVPRFVEEGGYRTEQGVIIGTPMYMSPEQARGDTATAASDMYSFALLLQWLFTGERPHPGVTGRELIIRAMAGETETVRGVDSDLAGLINALKSVVPEDRPTAAEVRDRLREISSKPMRRLQAMALALFMAVLLSGTILSTVGFVKARRSESRAVRARLQAEDLSSFMLEDLTPSLEALGRLDLLDQVAEKASAYYASLPPAESSPDVMLRRSLALRNACRVLRSQGRLEEARTAIDGSLTMARRLVQQTPDDPEYREQLADRLLELGALTQLTSDPDTAKAAFDRAVELYEKLVEEEPASVELRRGLARSLHGTAFELWAQAELDRALAALDRARDILERLLKKQPVDRRSALLLLLVYARIGAVQRDAGSPEEAAAMTRQGIELGERLVAADPANIQYLAALAECTSVHGFTLWQMGDLASALATYRSALRMNRQLVERDPTNQTRQRNLASSHSNVGEMLRGLGDLDGALQSLQASVAILEPLVAAYPDQAEWRYTLAVALLELGAIHAAQDRHEAATAVWERVVREMQPVALERGDLYYLDTYVRALLLLGRVDEARPLVTELLAKGWQSPAFLDLCQRHGLCG